MHYSITKKHTLSLHVKNIDIKNYAINAATAVVEGIGRGELPKTRQISKLREEPKGCRKLQNCEGTT